MISILRKSQHEKTNITIEDLWKIKRPAGLSMSPDGSQVVCALSRYDMAENSASSDLWLLSTFGGDARQLTNGGEKDGQASFSPDGSAIAFISKRAGDDVPQLYVIAPDGGEARRVTTLATGVAGIKWFPSSKKIAFISWVWPDLGDEKSQAKRLFDKKT
ncbi:MAG: hypothetical protein HC782_03375 [Gammaproteobacteria bacterium]|nr:hypothetical protein [Gammaproteobacteria bacterium]